MAAGTFTKILDTEEVWGTTRRALWTYVGNAAYTPGGDTPPSNLGLRAIQAMVCVGCNTAALGILPVWNTQTGKLQLLQSTWTGVGASGPLTEFSGNASTFSFTMTVWSIDN